MTDRAKDTTPPAYPVPAEPMREGAPGMSQRQAYALAAMQGMLAGSGGELRDHHFPGIAQLAFYMADCMLEAGGESTTASEVQS